MRSSRSTLASVLFVSLVACGDDGTNKLADAPNQGSGSADAPLTGNPVKMTVTLDGAPKSGVKVYFLNADSTVVSNATTGADGTASAVMADGGSVTVIEPATGSDGTDFLDTFAAVKAGDSLHDDVSDGNDSGSGSDTSITFDLTVPIDPNANVASYEIDSTCGFQDITPAGSGSGSGSGSALRKHRLVTGNNAPVSVTLTDCGGSADLIIATRDAGENLLDSIFVSGQTLADGTPVTITGPYVAAGATALSYTNLGAASDVQVTKFASTAAGVVDEEFGDVTVTAGAGTGSVAFPVFAATQQIVESEMDDASAFEGQTGYDWSAPSDTYAFDGSTHLLPHFTATPTFDATANALAWTQSTGGKTVDGVYAGAEFERAAGSGSAATTQDWVWSIIAPGTEAGSVTFPTLPTDVFDFKATATDSLLGFAVETYSLPGGYDAFRPIGFQSDDSIAFGAALASASGTVQIASATQPQDSVRRAQPKQHAHHRHFFRAKSHGVQKRLSFRK